MKINNFTELRNHFGIGEATSAPKQVTGKDWGEHIYRGEGFAHFVGDNCTSAQDDGGKDV